MINLKIWISILSLLIPDRIKGGAWLLWDRRMSWLCARLCYKDFIKAYSTIRLHESTRLLIMQCYKVTK